MLQKSVLLRMLVMGILMVVLMVPLGMTHGVIAERTARRDQVAIDISRTWGARQTLAGPVLEVPYQYVDPDARDATGAPRARTRRGSLVLLPERLDVEGTLEAGTRSRGPFSSVVYTARLVLRGHFGVPDRSPVALADATFNWLDATASVGVSDPRGIASGVRFVWAGREVVVRPGVADTGVATTGIQARNLAVAPDTPTSFEITLDLRGTGGLDVVPVGSETSLALASRWPHPGFGGQLPHDHRLTAEGFDARWQAGWFARGFPAAWDRTDMDVVALGNTTRAAAMRIDLLQPVDVYQQSERAVKYAALFIVLTLAVTFLREVTASDLVHPVQYLFVGFGLCLFYLLLVSLAEHITFDRAYLCAASSTVGLIAWYWSGVSNGRRGGLTLGTALGALYGYLYLLLRLEDFALVAGATGLFVMLAIVMAMTRHVNWFALRLGDGGPAHADAAPPRPVQGP